MISEIEKNIAKNIRELRVKLGMKQSELGEKIAYSDKTVSKWENGSSVPDVAALAELADIFDVTVDDLIRPNAVERLSEKNKETAREDLTNDVAMLCLSILSVYTIAAIAYVALIISNGYRFWQAFVWAIPPSALIAYRFNKIRANVRWINALLLSIFTWTLITATYLQLLSYNLWPLFFLGIPLEAMIIISTLFRRQRPPISSVISRILSEELARFKRKR